jgi:hypothetical protein
MLRLRWIQNLPIEMKTSPGHIQQGLVTTFPSKYETGMSLLCINFASWNNERTRLLHKNWSIKQYLLYSLGCVMQAHTLSEATETIPALALLLECEVGSSARGE